MSDGPLGFAPNEHREGGDIVKQDFIASDGREGTKKLAAFSISLLFLSCLFNGIKVGIFASRWFGEGGREGENFLGLTSNLSRPDRRWGKTKND